MEDAWISKNYGDDLDLQCTYTCIRVLDRRLMRYDTGEELFQALCESRGVGGADVLVNTSLSMNINSFELLTIRIGRLRLRRRGSIPVLTIFVVYEPTSNYDEEGVKRSIRTSRSFTKKTIHFSVINGDSNAKTGLRTMSEERRIRSDGLKRNEEGERLSEFIMMTKTIHGNSLFQNLHP
ncbi:unnamed protein product [Angiostrongylus costaricensis]|uniref:Uncharacterized protein n=1 Tax=Angiostrongylus costaricensis TaxID=334426 RepID=A0A0R3PHU9_ANGCS|nr:unnamed protein product [Angiostrongylus costaricensis]